MRKREEKWPRYRITVAADDSILLEKRNGRLGTWEKKDAAFFTTLFFSFSDLPTSAATFILHGSGLEHAALLGGATGAALLGTGAFLSTMGMGKRTRCLLLPRYTYEPFLSLPQKMEEGDPLKKLQQGVAALLSTTPLVQGSEGSYHASSPEIDEALPRLLAEVRETEELVERQEQAKREVLLRRKFKVLASASPSTVAQK